MAVEGAWDCVMKTRAGPQEFVLTVDRDGDTFTGTNSNGTDSIDLNDGKIDGNTITWTMSITKPLPLKLRGNATVDGDTLNGIVDGGMLAGKMELTGTRKVLGIA